MFVLAMALASRAGRRDLHSLRWQMYKKFLNNSALADQLQIPRVSSRSPPPSTK